MGKCLPLEKSRTRADIVAASEWIKCPSLGQGAGLVGNYTFSKSQTKDGNKQQRFRNWMEGQGRSWFMIFLSSCTASSHQEKQKRNSAIFRLRPTPQVQAAFSSLILSQLVCQSGSCKGLQNGLEQKKGVFLGLLQYPYNKPALLFWTILYLSNHHTHNLPDT